MSHALLPDFVVAHHLDTTDTIYAAVTNHPTPDVPASTQRGWRARFRRNTTTLVSASAATTIALGGDVTSTSALDDTLCASGSRRDARPTCSHRPGGS